jgi:very-short-patch-repair endonuclease
MYTQLSSNLSSDATVGDHPFRAPLRQRRDAKDVLWDAIRSKRLSEIAFRRNHAFGSIIADYFATQHHLVIFVNEPGVSSKHWFYARQDAQLRHMGFRVLRFTDDEVHHELPLVLDSIVEVVSQIARRMKRL